MRILCDNCSAKYSIADEKVMGKVFKIRCKKCSHVILVRGDGASGPGEAAATQAPAQGGVWYVVRAGQQDGPYAEADMQGLLASGEVQADTYTWREGFADCNRGIRISLDGLKVFRKIHPGRSSKAYIFVFSRCT